MECDSSPDFCMLDSKLCRGVVVISTALTNSAKREFRFCAGSNPFRGVSEIGVCENL